MKQGVFEKNNIGRIRRMVRGLNEKLRVNFTNIGILIDNYESKLSNNK